MDCWIVQTYQNKYATFGVHILSFCKSSGNTVNRTTALKAEKVLLELARALENSIEDILPICIVSAIDPPTTQKHTTTSNQQQMDSETFGPSRSSQRHATDDEHKSLYNNVASVSIKERESLRFGKQSYSDVLYGSNTPCGKYYESLKPFLRDKQSIDDNAKLLRKFKHCIAEHLEFYSIREASLQTIKEAQDIY